MFESLVFVFLEFNDVKWCFEVREIVFHKDNENGVDYLDASLRNEEAHKSVTHIDKNSDLYATDSESDRKQELNSELEVNVDK